MQLWRLCKRINHPLDGEGARRWGGRWNHPGIAVVYASGTLSLAVLEFRVHVPDARTAPDDLVAVPVDLPDRCRVTFVSNAELPRDWTACPAPKALADIGTAWARSRDSLVLSVPSAVLPFGPERNYLINPAHPGFSGIAAAKPVPLRLDPRLWGKPNR